MYTDVWIDTFRPNDLGRFVTFDERIAKIVADGERGKDTSFLEIPALAAKDFKE